MSGSAPWGKCSSAGKKHPLVDHCVDVAIVFQALIEASRTDLGLMPKEPRLLRRLAVIAFLHDFGKCNRGFQAKSEPHARDTAGHVLEALAVLMDQQDRWRPAWADLMKDVCGWFATEEQAFQMLVASISHHGRPVSLDDYHASSVERSSAKWWAAANGYDPMEALDELAEAARRYFPGAFEVGGPVIDATPALQQRFAGLVMLADWVGSDTQFFPYRQAISEDRFAFAANEALRALRAIGLSMPESRHSKSFELVFPFTPTPLQSALAERIAPDADNRLLLAESDTGSGKTEAALAWFFRLYADCCVDGLYFALPTRVAAREIYDRVLRAIATAFEADHRPGPVLLAAPGYVKVDGHVAAPLLANPTGTLWDDNARDRRRERLWSAERPKRFLAAPVAVGTIDQALLSVLQVKHSLLRSVCLDRHLLVVDEVHASDPYMREVLQALLRGHLARGGWALLLSATLGESAASTYFERPVVPLHQALQRPYPLLSASKHAWPMPSMRNRSIEVELSPTLTSDEALIPRLIDALQKSARILVVCNTVARANTLFQGIEHVLNQGHPELLPALFALDGARCPHHGRFAREDRELMDVAVTKRLGKGSPDGPCMLIGTQTLEQSLDIDADWLVTDLAPMDVLIQRLGRLHRHERSQRPFGFEIPRVLIRTPEQELTAYLMKDGTLRGPAGLGSVYADGRVLALTWQALRKNSDLHLPQQARDLIERTTHPECFAELPEPWLSHGHFIEGKELGEVRQALRSVLDDQPFGELHYADKSERILTRLGSPTYDLPLARAIRSPFGALIERVSIPARWLHDKDLPDSIHADEINEGFRFSAGETSFRYTRIGLEKDDA